MNDKLLRVGVIGVGAMGQNHLRVLSDMPGVEVRAICEPHEGRRLAQQAQHRVPQAFERYEECLDRAELDALVIAVNPELHRDVALAAFARGLPVLLEKPIAHTLDDAHAIVEAAEEAHVPCLVGHIERFNPVVRMATRFIAEGLIGTPYLCNTVRSGPFPRRLLQTEVGVLTDLAVHDVDIVQVLCGARIEEVQALFIRTATRELFAKTLFRTGPGLGGALAGSMEFSWISPQKIRSFQLFGTLGQIEGNYITQTLRFYENSDETVASDPWTTQHLTQGRVTSGRIIEYPVWRTEPLREELTHFVEVARGLAAPEIGPKEAMDVLRIVLEITRVGQASPTTITCPV